jgi:hypothetical protein
LSAAGIPGAPGPTIDQLDFVPTLRTGFERRDIGSESVVWSPLAAEPAVLDPVASVMLDVIDGTASTGEIAMEVHEEIGISLVDAQRQVSRVVEQLHWVGLLTTSPAVSTPEQAIADRDFFVSPSTPCSETASRLGTVTLNLRFGERIVRVACDSRRAARTLRTALSDELVSADDEMPLAFVLTAPQGFRRTHQLVDRAGLVLSEGRGLDTGLHALASHLTALLPPAPGTLRFRARAITGKGHTMLCLYPLLSVPVLSERDLAQAGLQLIDRLALDFDRTTGQILHPEIPWPTLATLAAGSGHLGTGGRRTVTTVVATGYPDSGPPTEAAVVAQLAANGLHGSPADLIDVARLVVKGAEVHSTIPDLESLLGLVNVITG